MRTELVTGAVEYHKAAELATANLHADLETMTAEETAEYEKLIAPAAEAQAPAPKVPIKSPIIAPLRKRRQSRSDRWNEAVAEARSKVDKLIDARDEAVQAISALNEVRAEYEEWRDNLPESLRASVVGEKLQVICDLDLEPSESDIDAMETAVGEAEGADLPLGFGRD